MEAEREMELEMTPPCLALTDLTVGERGTIEPIALPSADQQFLMRVGVVPGAKVRSSPCVLLGDPSVCSVDGTVNCCEGRDCTLYLCSTGT